MIDHLEWSESNIKLIEFAMTRQNNSISG